jgi:hypothetical protein
VVERLKFSTGEAGSAMASDRAQTSVAWTPVSLSSVPKQRW